MNKLFKFILALFSLNLILNKSLFNLCLNLNSCGKYCDCGQPARPPETLQFLTNKKLLFDENHVYYENESKIKYKCLDQNNLLIGTDTRTCQSGKWMGSIPKCGLNLKNNIRLSSIEILRNDSTEPLTLELTRNPDFYNTGIYSVPYYLKPRECVDWTIRTGDQRWMFHINQFIDINYIQIVLYSKENLQNILFSKSRQTLRFIISSTTSEDVLCKLLKRVYKRNYLTLDYECGSKQALNQRLESITLEYKSQKLAKDFTIALCQLHVYQIPDTCGTPDYTLSTIATNQSSGLFNYNCKDGTHIIEGQPTIKCNRSTGRWTGETPICLPKQYCKLIDNIFDTKMIINYEEINVLENGEQYVSDGKLAYFQCNHTGHTNRNTILHNSVTQVICRRGQWFGLSSLPRCENTAELRSNDYSYGLTDRLTIMLMGSIIGILIIPTILLIKRSLKKKKSKCSMKNKTAKEDIYDDTDNSEEHYYSEIDYYNIKDKLKYEDKFDSLKSSCSSDRNKNIYVENVV